MGLVSLRNVTVQLGSRVVLDGINMDVQQGERLGLVGENGAGKSTLLAVIAGELKPDGGSMRVSADVAFARQYDDLSADSANMAESAVDDKENGEIPSEFPGSAPAFALRAGIEARFHVDNPEQDALTMSGGERTRRRLVQTFASHAPLILLDEPTANLDADGCDQLEHILGEYNGAFILVSHDRALLDNVCDAILALEDGKLRKYTGGWSDYKRIREEQRVREQFEYDQYRAEEKRLKRAIQGVRESRDQVKKTPSRMGNSEARLHKRASTDVQKHLDQARKQLESRIGHLDKKPRPTAETKLRMSDNLPQNCQGIISDTALRIKSLTLCGGDKLLLNKASAEIPARGVTALIGENGCGKSTFLRAIANGHDDIRRANGLRIGYFAQDALEALNPSATLLENVLRESAYPQDVARTVLARLGLKDEDTRKQTAILSGGERAKCLLVSLLLAPHNFLLLDEPGNYLDIYAMDALETLLTTYPHGILMVSHDRRLIDETSAARMRIIEHGLKRV